MKRAAEDSVDAIAPPAKRAGAVESGAASGAASASEPPVPAQKISSWPAVPAGSTEGSLPSGPNASRKEHPAGTEPASQDDSKDSVAGGSQPMDKDDNDVDPAPAVITEAMTNLASGVYVSALSQECYESKETFLSELKAFVASKGKGKVQETLTCLGQAVDLHDFFRAVLRAGGAREASRIKRWRRVGVQCGCDHDPANPSKAPAILKGLFDEALYAFEGHLVKNHGLVLPKRPERGPRKDAAAAKDGPAAAAPAAAAAPNPTKPKPKPAAAKAVAAAAAAATASSGATTPGGDAEPAPRSRGVRAASEEPPSAQEEELAASEVGDPLVNSLRWVRAVALRSGRMAEEDGGVMFGDPMQRAGYRLQRYRLATSLCRSSRRDRRGVDRFEASFESDLPSFRTRLAAHEYPRKESRVGSNFQARVQGFVYPLPQEMDEDESRWLQHPVWPPEGGGGRRRGGGGREKAGATLAETLGPAGYDLGLGWSMGLGAGEEWSAEEVAGFAAGMEASFKDFGAIRRDHVPTRSVKEVISFYYNFWKGRGCPAAKAFYEAREAEKKARAERAREASEKGKKPPREPGLPLPPEMAQRALVGMIQWVRDLAKKGGSRWKGSKPSEFTRTEAGKRLIRAREAVLSQEGQLESVQKWMELAVDIGLSRGYGYPTPVEPPPAAAAP